MTLAWSSNMFPPGLGLAASRRDPHLVSRLDSWLIGHHRISTRGLAGLVLGIAGLVVLLWPKLAGIHALGWMQFNRLGEPVIRRIELGFGSVLSKWEIGG